MSLSGDAVCCALSPVACLGKISKRLAIVLAVLVAAAAVLAVILAIVLSGTAGRKQTELVFPTGSSVTCDQYSVRCDNEFECVKITDVCNGYEQCSDHSDEKNCSTCPAYRFACGNGMCLRREWLCDREADCSNGADELSCDNCNASEFTCNNYNCVNRAKVCDGANDCDDFSDENDCYFLASNQVVSYVGHGGNAPICYDNVSKVAGGDLCALIGLSPVNAKVSPAEGVSVAQQDQSNTVVRLLPASGEVRSNPPSVELLGICPADNRALALKCESCGKQELKRNKRVLGGRTVSSAATWPWYVRIIIAGRRLCGGTLVSHQLALTAAHCVVNWTGAPSEVVLTMGSRALLGADGTQRSALSVHVHPRFASYRGTYDNDVAVLEFAPVEFGATIKPVCLPRPWDEPGFNKPTSCYVVGLGDILLRAVVYPMFLQEAKVKIWPRDSCQKSYYDDNHIDISPAMMCAGSDSAVLDTCTGDSGGPLMCQRRGCWVLAGVTSWGFSCGSFKPSIYASVANALPWLSQFIDVGTL